MPADARTASDTHTTRNHRVGANTAVVTDLYQIIQLDAFLDDRIIKRATIYRGIRANFHRIPDHDAPDLRNFHPAASIFCISKSISPHHYAGTEHAILTDLATRIYRHICM